jgi:hypothetical protein
MPTLDRPFIFVGHFECESCHRPITTVCHFEQEDDWEDHPFSFRCSGCGWGRTNHPGQNAVHYSQVEWTQQIR